MEVITTLDVVTGLFFYLLVCGLVDVYCCVLTCVPFGPWLSDKGCKRLKPYMAPARWAAALDAVSAPHACSTSCALHACNIS